MRQKTSFIPTLREIPNDAEARSHQLMLRAGLMRQIVSGVYSYLPLGQRVLRKVQDIVREEMEKAEVEELFLSTIQPKDLFLKSGRWDYYGPDLMKLKDRHERDFVLGPTHEELITNLVGDEVKTYKKLPICVYQIQTKFRDEKRPRFGVLRSREFIMKDAYSFHATEECLDKTYKSMYNAYISIFKRCGLNFRAVEADSGAMGGTDTHEFMVLTEVGEDTIAHSDRSEYAANIEKAVVTTKDYEQITPETENPACELALPDGQNLKDVKKLVKYLDINEKQVIKTVALNVNSQVVLALVRGDYDINETKVKNLLGADKAEVLSDQEIINNLHSHPDFLGPIGLENVKIIADYSIKGMKGIVVGANRKNTCIINVNPELDFLVESYNDIRNIVEGDPSPCGNGHIKFTKGIEAGHIFKIGEKYSKAFNKTFINEVGQEQSYIMGCYGIGITRLLGSIIEQNCDSKGIIWPKEVSPFDLHLITLNSKDTVQHDIGEELYKSLQSKGYSVLFDDRLERAGVKFNDSDLLGIPWRVVVGMKAVEGIVELRNRKTEMVYEISTEELNQFLEDIQ